MYIAEKCGEIREVVYKLAAKDVEETHVVLIVLKHLLFVHATKYGVINVSRGYRSSLPWHSNPML